ncbi:MAG: chemotaxis protein methyltransferase CheR, partial [Mycobacteriales bacterium]
MEPAASPDDTTRLRDLVRGRIGLALPAGGPDLTRVVRRATEAAAVADAAALCELLRAGVLPGEPLDALIGALNISETHFFRDAGQMAALEKVVLPELIARRRPERRLRVWSAGCSTGEEPYTLAMLIHRLLPDLAGWDVLVLGTDINGRSLATAQRGRYRAWSLRGMPDRARAAYLRPAADAREEVQVAPEIHRMVTFRQLNLAGEAYPAITGGMDLVLCRNVLLYFDDAAARAVVRRLRRVLPDDGWLLLSQVEAGLADADGLVPTPIGAAFRCCPRAGTWAAPAPAPASPPPPVPALARSATPALVPVPVPVPVAAEAEALARPRALAAPEAGQPVAGVGEAVDEAAACGLAVELWRDGRHEAALAGLAAAAARDPLLPRPHYLLALI